MTGDSPRVRGLADGLAPVLQTLVDECPPGRALDVATGTGRNALALAARGWTVDAVDISRAQLERARARERNRVQSTADRAAGAPGTDINADTDTGTCNWILADADRYCVPERQYDLVTVSFFDARNCLSALIDALAPGGCLWVEHYLESPADESVPADRFRLEPNELLAACSELTVIHYTERRVDGEPRVGLLARNERDSSRWRPELARSDLDGP
ncbi:class I SAM-dependent methyltransferase [Natronolimnohabitans innermongolicus]|uniref:Methyltransferase type 11 n=1 Tax=Natronolimnohabitans innermongolicus JCM 12255 TaxID=1227499 RepID=L9X5G9_9EURY|nr:class I SAM-dependent methyltransferase [Natronolimnohabitans innermongolicus]ELY57009.1 methyltransferase type 11 [Natronolimnohabitans innermongolicus JCM 12255]